ncbi:hypothetical protein PIB30_104007 [Stylosanthes scabra]|uniref:Putative plant transposon protein domain-containing protein n=1 Tax=Stylosanthes scabra TaxID=79078 RepID=A0ABU6RYI0_9FABA|nr:hypothetical protein [Stylosanthes scabra]
MASSSSISVFDNHRFKSAFNEELYNSIVKSKKVIAECCIDLDEDEYPEIKEQISLRGWRRLAAPKQEISIDLIHEFYANAILTKEEMEEAGGHTFSSYVRGKVVDFSLENLRNVMRFRAQVQGATTDFETRKEHDQQLDQVLADLCIPGATWKLSTRQMRVPIQLRRTIYKLCKEAGVPLREFRRTRKIQAEKPITARRMESTRLPRPIQPRQQEDEDEDHPMPQAGEENEEGNEGQVLQPSKARAKRNGPRDTTDKSYQVNQTLVDLTRYKAYMDELAAMKAKQEEFFSNQANQYNLIRQDHKLLGKEILDVKKYQMSAVTMGSSGSSSSTQPPPPPPYEPDQALMKIREQHATFTEICRQLKDWTRNASGRECYTVWAHQLANTNLVEMSSQKTVKQIYDNIDHKRPMFKGLLKSDLQPSDPTQPPSSSKDPKDPPSSSKNQKDPPK